jgi:hypothetical protein
MVAGLSGRLAMGASMIPTASTCDRDDPPATVTIDQSTMTIDH